MKLQFIREERKKLKLTQQDMADMLCVPKRTYAAWERGENNFPTDILGKLSKMFDVSVDYLITDGDCERKTKSKNEMIEKLKLLSEDQIEKVIEYAQFIEQNEKKE